MRIDGKLFSQSPDSWKLYPWNGNIGFETLILLFQKPLKPGENISVFPLIMWFKKLYGGIPLCGLLTNAWVCQDEKQ
jgi:hypothetical protein